VTVTISGAVAVGGTVYPLTVDIVLPDAEGRGDVVSVRSPDDAN